MIKLDLNLLKRFYGLAKLYWLSDEKKNARWLAVLLALLLVGDTAANVFFNQQSGEFTSALAAREGPRFWHSIRLYTGLLLAAVPIYAYYYYVRDTLAIRWRRWLTHHVLGRYFANHAFYRLQKDPEIDNPDQRIAEDISYFTQQSVNLFLMFASAAFQLVAFSGVLWSISHTLVLFLTLYAVGGTMVTYGVFGQRMVSLYFDRLRREADFRFSLVRVRENAESIALYRGEGREQGQVAARFAGVFSNFTSLISWGLRLNFFTNSYGLITAILPSIILAPRVLSGELEVGKVVQAAGAFGAILGSLTLFVDNLEYLSRVSAGVNRLDAFIATVSRPPSRVETGRDRIQVQEGPDLGFSDVTLQTPNYERTLIKGLNIQIPRGTGLLIVGTSGCGKSSLLRAIAGLWDAGGGTMMRPSLDNLLFLPQNAYMILGNLRQQLCYPNLAQNPPDAELREILERVNLPGLADRCGGFEVELDFEKDLSVGERQRLAFARVLLNHPPYVLLDEATSALDLENEAQLYQQLLSSETTIISVSHHPALVEYHSHVLELTDHGGWSLSPATEFEFRRELV